MKLSELHRIVNLHYNPEYPPSDEEVVVVIKLPYSTVGGRPCSKVKFANSGFDWDSGKFEMITEDALTLADADFEKQFRELQDKHGWLEYENRNLKAENKRLRKQNGAKE